MSALVPAPGKRSGLIYLSGSVRPEMAGLHPRLGFLFTPNMGNRRPPGAMWAADNGLFGTQAHRYTDERYLQFLVERGPEDCLFATAPDVVHASPDGSRITVDAIGTLARSRPMLDRIRALGFPAALIAQDGLTADAEGVRAGSEAIAWTDFDALFVAGTDDWKLGPECRRVMAHAAGCGLWVHVGRVNSQKRLLAATLAGAHSADGTYVAYGPTRNLPRVLQWLEASAQVSDHMHAHSDCHPTRPDPYGKIIERIRSGGRPDVLTAMALLGASPEPTAPDPGALSPMA